MQTTSIALGREDGGGGGVEENVGKISVRGRDQINPIVDVFDKTIDPHSDLLFNLVQPGDGSGA
ncbi:hypothetical protein RUND412_009597 [Rhizina undulata]